MACHWQSPPTGYLKMNTDASCMGNPGKASYGGLIRDESGGWVKGFSGNLPELCTPLEAEAWAICKGLNLIKQFGFKKVLVETDSVAAMQLFSFRHLHQNHPMKDVIEEGLEILFEHKCGIVHTRREGNTCADKLAKLGGKQSTDWKVINTPPRKVKKLLLQDRFGENWRKVTGSSMHPSGVLPLPTIESCDSAPIKSSLPHCQRPVCTPVMPPVRVLDDQKSTRGDLQPYHWQSPPTGYLKMNTDASCMGNPGKASYGGLIRDESGGWVKGFSGNLPELCTPLEAEAWAICKGLNLVKQFGFKKVLVETDSVAAMQLFSFRHLYQDHPMKVVIEEGLEILFKHKCVIVHTRREGNICAHKLAKLGGKQSGDWKVITTPPPKVKRVLLKDRFGEDWRKVTGLSKHPSWVLPLQTVPIISSTLHCQHPVCAPVMPPVGVLDDQKSTRGDLQSPMRHSTLAFQA